MIHCWQGGCICGGNSRTVTGGGKVTGDRLIKNHVPGEEELAVEITYQPAKLILNISNKDGLKTMCGTFSADLLRLMNEALAAEYL